MIVECSGVYRNIVMDYISFGCKNVMREVC